MKNSKNENYEKIIKKINYDHKKHYLYGSFVMIIILGLCFFTFQKKEEFLENNIIWSKLEETYENNALDVCGVLKRVDLINEISWYKDLKLPEGLLYQESYMTDCDKILPLEKKHYEVHGVLDDKIFQMSIGEENRGLSENWCYGGINLYLKDKPKSFIYNVEVVLLENEETLLANLYVHGYWVTITTENIDKNEFMNFLYRLIL